MVYITTNECFTLDVAYMNFSLQIAIRGKNFCFSAKDAFMLIMRNLVR